MCIVSMEFVRLNKMKVLVTGANGYLGTGVVKQLCNDGVEVIAVCHSRTGIVDKRADIKQCDIFNLKNPFVVKARHVTVSTEFKALSFP